MAQVIVSRRHVTGNITTGIYLVDLLCTGVKDSFFLFNEPEETLSRLTGEMAEERGLVMETCDYALAHNIIYSSLEFAGENGIEPVADFATTKMILEEDDEKIELIDIECGKDGKPLLVSDSLDSRTNHYLKQLKKYAGEGNYHFLIGVPEENQEKDVVEENEDLFFDDPEDWSNEEWEDFLINGSPEDLEANEDIPVYIYQKAILQPAAASRQLDINAFIEKCTTGISYDPVIYKEYGNDTLEKKEAEDIYYILTIETPSKIELINLLARIGKAMEKWPGNPIFHNHLYNAYILLNEKEKAEALLLEQMGKFPDYLFGKIVYAHDLLRQGSAEKIPTVFNGHFDLVSLYPERDSFHISEFISFTTILCLYFIDKKDDLMAGVYGTMLREWALDTITPLTEDALLLLDTYLLLKVTHLLAEAHTDDTKREALINLLVN